jgi:O-antigen/teichoic acid export membrane protein
MPEVAASKSKERAELLWARSLRLAIYMHVALLPILWLTAPLVLKTLFGENFVPATSTFRWLLIAATVWSLGSIVISGLRGFGYPGMSTLARFSAAVVTAGALLILLPRLGIIGAAIASLIGYTVMLVIAMYGFLKKRQLGLWECLRPQRRDLVIPGFKSLRMFAFAKVGSAEEASEAL